VCGGVCVCVCVCFFLSVTKKGLAHTKKKIVRKKPIFTNLKKRIRAHRASRGVIMVSTVTGVCKVCIAHTLVLVNLLYPKHVLRHLYEYCWIDWATEACTKYFQ